MTAEIDPIELGKRFVDRVHKRTIWQRVLIGVFALGLLGNSIYTDVEQHTQIANIQQVQSANSARNKELTQDVQGLTGILTYIGDAFTAVCNAEPHCMIPPYPIIKK